MEMACYKTEKEREKDKTPWFVLDIISQNHLDSAYNHLSCFFLCHRFGIHYYKKDTNKYVLY